MPEPDDGLAELFTAAYNTLLRDAPAAPPLEPAEPAGPLPATWTYRRTAAWLAAAAAVVVAGGTLVLFQGDRVDPARNPMPVVDAPLDPSSVFNLVDFRDGNSFAGVVPGDGILISVDNDGIATSTDGQTWNLSHSLADGETVSDIATAAGRFVAVGYDESCFELLTASGRAAPDGDDDSDEDEIDYACQRRTAAVWTSDDGHTWTRVAHDEMAFGSSGFAQMNAVTAGGPGFVAVGRIDTFEGSPPVLEGTPVDADAAAWTSADGLRWTKVEHDEDAFGGDRNQEMVDVVAGGPGLVAVGRDGRGLFWGNSLAQNGAVWISPDGIGWARVPIASGVFGLNTAILSVTNTDDGLVAVGHGNGWTGPVWTSPDGLVWEIDARLEDDNGIWLTDVGVGNEGLVLIAGVADASQVWRSTDGTDWMLAPGIVTTP